jgi:hypothetical protein
VRARLAHLRRVVRWRVPAGIASSKLIRFAPLVTGTWVAYQWQGQLHRHISPFWRHREHFLTRWAKGLSGQPKCHEVTCHDIWRNVLSLEVWRTFGTVETLLSSCPQDLNWYLL